MAAHTAMPEWRDKARALRAEGLSERQIAAEVGKSPSSVHDALKETTTMSEPQTTIDGREVYDAVPPPEEIVLAGSQQLALDVGGKRAQTAQITFTGCKATVDGFFRKGDRVVFQAVAVIREVGAKDKVDKQTGQVVDAVERYTAQVLDMTLVD